MCPQKKLYIVDRYVEDSNQAIYTGPVSITGRWT